MDKKFMCALAQMAGKICLEESARMSEESVEFKGEKDLVTWVDRRVEDYLRSEIAAHYQEHDILGEEGGFNNSGSDWCWIIDPIDGTTSYAHGLPGYSISIALRCKGQVVAGVVYAPVLDQMFFAAKGEGATLNGMPIRVSTRSGIANSIVASGFACIRAGERDNNLAAFNRVVVKARDVRRHGSAALDLAWVAAGKFDGYWERCLNVYDVAAGALLVLEAGGVVSDLRGGQNYPENGIIATNNSLAHELLQLVNGE